MKVISGLIQGSDAWHAHRANYRNASESPFVMDESPHRSRSAHIKIKATGIEQQIDEHTQKRFDEGHRFEALARPIAEQIMGVELSPITGVDGKYSASFDGIDEDYSVCFEHKALNAELRKVTRIADLPRRYKIQMETQLMVSGAERCLFMASEWTDDDELIDEIHFWYDPDLSLRAEICKAWDQFDEDLENYKHVEITPTPVAAPVKDLPALFVQVRGEVTSTNMPAFKAVVTEFLAGLNLKPTTDQEFADGKVIAKKLREGAKALQAKGKEMLDQTADIGAMKREIDFIADEMNRAALTLEKAITTEEADRKAGLIAFNREALNAHVAKLNKRLGRDLMPVVPEAFALCIKGLSKFESMQNAVATELAKRKIEANDIADTIEINLKSLSGEAHDWTFLFPDLKAVIAKPVEDFAALLCMRVQAHQDAEAKRIEAERERIRKEETAKIQAEQAAERERIQADTPPSAQGAHLAPTASTVSVEQDGLVTLQRSESGQVLDSILAELYSMPLDELKLVAHAIERIKLHRRSAA